MGLRPAVRRSVSTSKPLLEAEHLTPLLRPGKRRSDRLVQRGARRPTEQRLDLVDVGEGPHSVPYTRWSLADGDGRAEYPLEGRDQLTHGHPVPGADVHDHTGLLDLGQDRVELLHRGYVRQSEIPDVDVVPQAGSVASRMLRASDDECIPQTTGSHHQLTEDVRRLSDVYTGLQLRVAADGVEVAQDHRAKICSSSHVVEHHLHHQLCPGVRRPGSSAEVSSTSKSSV